MNASASVQADLPSQARIRWLCRRGMKELDVLLELFFAAEYASLSTADQTLFYTLVQLEDPELYGYMMGRNTPDQADLAEMVIRIRDYRVVGTA